MLYFEKNVEDHRKCQDLRFRIEDSIELAILWKILILT